MIIFCLLVLIASRVVLIGYLDAISFWTLPRYLMPIYPCLMALIGLVVPEFKLIWNLAHRKLPRVDAKGNLETVRKMEKHEKP